VHVPDGFLDARTAVITGLLAAGGVGAALARLRRTLPASRVPMLGLTAAFVFAAQMLNFPVAGGTSGHLVGAALVTVLLGPSAAVVVLTAVLVLQCLMFADGGLTALGANVFNMAVVAPAAAALALRLAGGRGVVPTRRRLFAAALAAWFSIVAAAVTCAGELAFSGTAAWAAVFPAMTTLHLLIGLGEAVITTLFVAALAAVRPELTAGPAELLDDARGRELVLSGLALALALALFVAPFASAWPDGLERVADRLGFAPRAAAATLPAPLAGYSVPGFDSPVAATMAAGALGTALAFLLAWLLARALAARLGRRRGELDPLGPAR
jgi:cobalt/nickel transport system permease protein